MTQRRTTQKNRNTTKVGRAYINFTFILQRKICNTREAPLKRAPRLLRKKKTPKGLRTLSTFHGLFSSLPSLIYAPVWNTRIRLTTEA